MKGFFFALCNFGWITILFAQKDGMSLFDTGLLVGIGVTLVIVSMISYTYISVKSQKGE